MKPLKPVGLTMFLVVVVHVVILALAVVGDSNAQNSPDCTACVLQCAEDAQSCRADAETRADECADACFDGSLWWKKSCLKACWNTRNSEVASCDRDESSCVTNCYI